MSYTAITTDLVTEFKANVRSLWNTIRTNFNDHQSRINILENVRLAIPTGFIMEYGSEAPPPGYLLCDGSAVSRTDYAALFAKIGTFHGSGDNVTTFNLPDMRGRSPVGYYSGDSDFGVIGQSGGEETHQLTTAEIPSHSHSFSDTPHTHGWDNAHLEGGAADVIDHGVSNIGNTPSKSSTTSTTGISVNNAGSDSAHNNMHPFLCSAFIIKT